MKNVLNSWFPEKNENYNIAKKSLRAIKKRFDGFVVSFPDVTPDEIILIKDKWEQLPKSISTGVKYIALDLVDGCKSLLINYDSNGYMEPHKHDSEYEYGIVLKGSLENKSTGEEYYEGDQYVFNPNELHDLQSSDDGCLVYSALSINSDFHFQPLPEKIQAQL